MDTGVENYILETTRKLYIEGKLDMKNINPQVLAAALGRISFDSAVAHDSTPDPTLRSDPRATTIASLSRKI